MTAPNETALQRSTRLRAEIDAREEEMWALAEAAKVERVLAGLNAMGRAGARINVTNANSMCVSGKLQGVEETVACNTFDLSYGASIVAIDTNGGIHVSVSHSREDGVEVQVSWRDENDLRVLAANRVANWARAKAFLAGYGIALDATAMREKRVQTRRELDDISTLIAVVEAGPSPQETASSPEAKEQ